MAEFIYAYDLDGGERRTKVFKSAGALESGVPVVLSSGAIAEAASGATSGVVGVTAYGASAAGEEVEVITNRGAVFKVEYEGTTKTFLTEDDLGAKFGYNPTTNKLNLDDTTDGWLIVVAFDNNGKYAWVRIADNVRGI